MSAIFLLTPQEAKINVGNPIWPPKKNSEWYTPLAYMFSRLKLKDVIDQRRELNYLQVNPKTVLKWGFKNEVFTELADLDESGKTRYDPRFFAGETDEVLSGKGKDVTQRVYNWLKREGENLPPREEKIPFLTPQEMKMIVGSLPIKPDQQRKWYMPVDLPFDPIEREKIIQKRKEMEWARAGSDIAFALDSDRNLFLRLGDIDRRTGKTIYNPRVLAVDGGIRELKEGKGKDVTQEVYRWFENRGEDIFLLRGKPRRKEKDAILKEGGVSPSSEHLG